MKIILNLNSIFNTKFLFRIDSISIYKEIIEKSDKEQIESFLELNNLKEKFKELLEHIENNYYNKYTSKMKTYTLLISKKYDRKASPSEFKKVKTIESASIHIPTIIEAICRVILRYKKLTNAESAKKKFFDFLSIFNNLYIDLEKEKYNTYYNHNKNRYLDLKTDYSSRIYLNSDSFQIITDEYYNYRIDYYNFKRFDHNFVKEMGLTNDDIIYIINEYDINVFRTIATIRNIKFERTKLPKKYKENLYQKINEFKEFFKEEEYKELKKFNATKSIITIEQLIKLLFGINCDCNNPQDIKLIETEIEKLIYEETNKEIQYLLYDLLTRLNIASVHANHELLFKIKKHIKHKGKIQNFPLIKEFLRATKYNPNTFICDKDGFFTIHPVYFDSLLWSNKNYIAPGNELTNLEIVKNILQDKSLNHIVKIISYPSAKNTYTYDEEIKSLFEANKNVTNYKEVFFEKLLNHIFENAIIFDKGIADKVCDIKIKNFFYGKSLEYIVKKKDKEKYALMIFSTKKEVVMKHFSYRILFLYYEKLADYLMEKYQNHKKYKNYTINIKKIARKLFKKHMRNAVMYIHKTPYEFNSSNIEFKFEIYKDYDVRIPYSYEQWEQEMKNNNPMILEKMQKLITAYSFFNSNHDKINEVKTYAKLLELSL